jgi:glycosyltransferase involved in cell wall biosynthesis
MSYTIPTGPDRIDSAHERCQPQLACVVVTRDVRSMEFPCLNALVEQSVRVEIVVVNCGRGNPAAVTTRFGDRVRVIHHGGTLTSGAARNLGLRATRAPFVAFLTGACEAHPDWAKHLIDAHATESLLIGAIDDAPNAGAVALASALLYHATILPGSCSEPYIRRWESYARSTFQHFGLFDEAARADPSLEFHRRVAGSLEIGVCDGALMWYQHPQGFRGLLRRQRSRGRRAGEGVAASGRQFSARRLCTTARRRLAKMLLAHFRNARVRDRIAALQVVLIAAAGGFAFESGVYSRVPRGWSTRRRTRSLQAPRIHALLQVHNGAELLPGYLDNLRGKVAGVIALDDGSSDDTRRILADSDLVCHVIERVRRDPHVWDEPGNRMQLAAAARTVGAGWVIGLDVDERLPANFVPRAALLIGRARREGISAYALWLRELWDRPDCYRVDGVWGSKRVARLFDLRAGGTYDTAELHAQWAPLETKKNGKYVQAEIQIFHLGVVDRQARFERRRKHEALDPGRLWQPSGYEYMTDDTGLICCRIPDASMYAPTVDAGDAPILPPSLAGARRTSQA